jgi:hypothetical protein
MAPRPRNCWSRDPRSSQYSHQLSLVFLLALSFRIISLFLSFHFRIRGKQALSLRFWLVLTKKWCLKQAAWGRTADLHFHCSCSFFPWPEYSIINPFFCVWGGTYVTRYCGHFWPIVQPQMIDEGDYGAIGGMKIGRGKRSTWRKPAPAPFCPPQIPLDQTRARTRAAAVGSQRLTAW